MCGIAGWVRSGADYSAKGLVKAMADTIAHRGPDEEGYFFAPGVGLGHKRLSIIDLEHGHQPMITEDNRYTIVYNGEVYNFRALKKELESMGEKFTTHSDTEVLLKAFRQWGPNSFSRFSGMFAIAIWDNTEKTLHLVRDQIGIKPLYYIELGDELIFASEIKALLRHPGVKRLMDPEVVASFLAFNNTFGAKSFWSGVRRCEPGEWLEWRDGKIKSFRYFDIASLKTEPFTGTFGEAANKYKELLTCSVTDHLVSDVPVGSYLSAGIDSGSVSSLAVQRKSCPFPVFTGYFKGHEEGWYDERKGAAAISGKGGMTHYECPITWNDFHERLDKVCYHLDEPTLGSGAIPQFIVAGEVREHVKVVLTGHGGDELFGGYPVYKAAFMRRHPFRFNNLRGMFSAGADEWIRIAYFLVGSMVDPIRGRGQFRMFSSGALTNIGGPAVKDALIRNNGIEGIFERLMPFNSKTDVDGVTRWYVSTYLTTLLIQEDKISMAHSLEARVPICYEPLLKFSLSLPDDIKLYRGLLKAVPKEGMKEVLPRQIYSLPKRGFPTPIVDWLSKEGLSGEWESAWDGRIPRPLEGLLNPKMVKREFSRFRRGGYRMPNAYAAAHKIISLQMLHACAKALDSIETVKDMRR